MAFGTQDDTDDVMNEINMTPFVDVMLVLLIIFIITVPVMKHAVNIDLPRASNQPQDSKPETIRLEQGGTAATPESHPAHCSTSSFSRSPYDCTITVQIGANLTLR